MEPLDDMEVENDPTPLMDIPDRITVLSADPDHEETKEIVKRVSLIPTQTLPQSDERKVPESSLPRACKAFEETEYSSGILILPCRSMKKAEIAQSLESFYVVSAETNSVRVLIHKTEFIASAGDSFQIPPGNTYVVENLSRKREIKFYFTLLKPFTQLFKEFLRTPTDYQQAVTSSLERQNREEEKRHKMYQNQKNNPNHKESEPSTSPNPSRPNHSSSSSSSSSLPPSPSRHPLPSPSPPPLEIESNQQVVISDDEEVDNQNENEKSEKPKEKESRSSNVNGNGNGNRLLSGKKIKPIVEMDIDGNDKDKDRVDHQEEGDGTSDSIPNNPHHPNKDKEIEDSVPRTPSRHAKVSTAPPSSLKSKMRSAK